jgi:hypothetical protein
MNILSCLKNLFGSNRRGYYCPSCGLTDKTTAECKKCLIPMFKIEKEEVTYIKMMPLFAPTGLAQLAVAKAMLEEAEIPYFVRNEISQNLFGAGMAGAGFNTASGAMIVEVAADRVDEATILLQDLAS